jgi:hypothetical protein
LHKSHAFSKNGFSSGAPKLPISGKNKLHYSNYAQGGAMGASDKYGIGLGTFDAQATEFLSNVGSSGNHNCLYIIWFGLNDLITNGRAWDKMQDVADEQIKICKKNTGSNRWLFSYYKYAISPGSRSIYRKTIIS